MLSWLLCSKDKFDELKSQMVTAAQVEHYVPEPVCEYYEALANQKSLKKFVETNCFFFTKSNHNLRARDPRQGELLFCPSISNPQMRIGHVVKSVETCVETDTNITFAATGYIHYISDKEPFHAWKKFANNDVVAWYYNHNCTEMIGLFRETLVFQKQDGWKLIHSHVSLALSE